MTLVLLVAALIPSSANAVLEGPLLNDTAPTFAKRHGCPHLYRSSVAYRQIRGLVRNTHPSVPKRKVQHFATCLATRAKAHEAHVRVRRWWAWRREYAQRWVIVFKRLPSSDQAWALNTGACESGNNPAANTGNGFYGSYQFTLPTAGAAGFTRRPDLTSWHEQAVRAVWWMHKAGASQWPVCGH